MNTMPLYRIQLVSDAALDSKAPMPLLRQAEDAVSHLRPHLEGLDREATWVMVLDSRRKVLGAQMVSLGTLTQCLVHPREVLKPVILLNGASFLVAHNHPSGDCTPSHDDTATCTRLRQAGELMGIPLLDFIVIGHQRHYSYANNGWS